LAQAEDRGSEKQAFLGMVSDDQSFCLLELERVDRPLSCDVISKLVWQEEVGTARGYDLDL
jgi:hypothetical protein